MVNSSFCLCPAGDTCVTSRLYTAIAAGCLPVVLCDQLSGAFPSVVPYSSFWIKYGYWAHTRPHSPLRLCVHSSHRGLRCVCPRYPIKRFVSNPAHLLKVLRTLDTNTTEMTRRRHALAAHRADVLYDEPSTRVGTRFLAAVGARCGVERGEGSMRKGKAAANDTECVRRAGIAD